MSLVPQGTEVRAEQVDAAVQSFRQRAFAQALRWGNRLEDAEDIAQEAAERLVRWPHLAQYPSARWVARITMHCAVAHAKLLRPHETLEEELICAREPDSEVDRAQIHSALTQLSAQEAQLVLLRYALGWPILAIAERLGMSVGATKIGVFRARHRLRSVLVDLVGSC
jgi:RNA polymerase sigma-70 factor (ECF subfamily)